MEKILVRSGVNPYDVYTPFEYLSKDLGGGNSGNLLFAASIFRNLLGKKRELFSNYYKLDLSKVDEINEKYNSFVIPLANAFRPNFNELDRLTKFIKNLRFLALLRVLEVSSNILLSLERSLNLMIKHENFVMPF